MISFCAFRWFGRNPVGVVKKTLAYLSGYASGFLPRPTRFARALKTLTTEPFFTVPRVKSDFSKPLLPFILTAL